MGKKRLSKKGLLVICVLCLVIGLVSGIFLSKTTLKTIVYRDTVYNQVAEILQESYLDTVDTDKTITQRLLKGLASGLGDPYTSYMEPQEADNLTTSINVSFVGVGVTYTKIEKGGIVVKVFKDSPADKAGIITILWIK